MQVRGLRTGHGVLWGRTLLCSRWTKVLGGLGIELGHGGIFGCSRRNLQRPFTFESSLLCSAADQRKGFLRFQSSVTGPTPVVDGMDVIAVQTW